MAEKKMTRVQALENAIEWIAEGAQGADTEMLETVEVLKKMVEQLQKPRKKAEGPSKARVQNDALAYQVADAIAAKGEPVNTKWITEHVSGILTPQKATAVCRVALDLGLIERQKDGKTVTYTA